MEQARLFQRYKGSFVAVLVSSFPSSSVSITTSIFPSPLPFKMSDATPINPDPRSGVTSCMGCYTNRSEARAGDAAGLGDDSDPVEEIGGDTVTPFFLLTTKY